MKRSWRHQQRTWRQWLGLGLVALLAFVPPFNLAGVDLVLDPGTHSHAEAGHEHDHHGHDHSGLAHHTSGSSCLQCLVMGGMALAGAAAMPHPGPQLYAIGAGWVLATPAWDSRASRTLLCRGPPALA